MQSETKEASSKADFSLFNLPGDYYDNPWVYFRRLRDHDPMHDNEDGSILLTRYEDVRAVWRDPTGLVDKSEQFRKAFGEGALLEHHSLSMLFRDPPDHDRLRAVVNPFFSQSAVKRLQRFIDETLDELLDETEERGEIDFVSDFAFRLPIAVICRILGVPGSDAARIHEMGARIIFPLNPAVSSEDIATGHQASEEFKDYLRPHLEAAKRRSDLDPTENILSAMVAAERGGAEMSEDEMLHMCILILNGGHETTTNLMAVSLHSLLDQPDALEDFRENPDIAPSAIEELLRFVSPLQLQGRRTTKSISIPSGEIAEGTEVILSQASANRDERVYDNPDQLNLRRRPNVHMAFGAGLHVCLGRPLARLEAMTALPRLLERFPRIERAGPHAFNRNARFRGLRTLPVTFKTA